MYASPTTMCLKLPESHPGVPTRCHRGPQSQPGDLEVEHFEDPCVFLDTIFCVDFFITHPFLIVFLPHFDMGHYSILIMAKSSFLVAL